MFIKHEGVKYNLFNIFSIEKYTHFQTGVIITNSCSEGR